MSGRCIRSTRFRRVLAPPLRKGRYAQARNERPSTRAASRCAWLLSLSGLVCQPVAASTMSDFSEAPGAPRVVPAVYLVAPDNQGFTASDASIARQSGPRLPGEVLSEAELQAMRSSGATCSSSIYRAAWPVAASFRVDPAVVAAIIETESSCNRNAVSSEGARGLMQLMPGTGARVAYRVINGRDGIPSITDLHDLNANIRLGVAYLSALLDHFGYVASPEARLRFAIASYNCGPDFIDRRLPLTAANWDATDAERWIAQHAPRQTRGYVVKVLRKSTRYALAVTAVHTDVASVDEVIQ